MIELKVRGFDADLVARLNANISLVIVNARLAAINFVTEIPDIEGLVHVVFGQATLLLVLEGVVDLEKERRRLENEQSKLETEIGKHSTKLNSEDFLRKAPDNVISDVRQKKQVAEGKKEGLIAALKLIH